MLLDLTTNVISTFFMGLIVERNTNKLTSTTKEIAQKQQEAQLKIALTQIEAQAQLEKRRQNHQDDLEMSRQQFQERMELLGFKQEVSLEQARQEFQLRLQSLDHQQQQAIENFRAEINAAINQKNLDFQQWKFEQEMRLQQQLAADNRETQLRIAEEQRKTAQALPEINKIFENWPLRIVPSQIINAQKGSGPIPLCVLISPPEVDSDKHDNTKNFPNIEESLASGLRKLLNKDYSLNDKYRPIELLDGAWDSNRFHGGSSIKVLFSMLKSEPMLVLESKVMLNDINLKVAYWGLGQEESSKYFYQEILKIPFKKILDEAAKARALKLSKTEVRDSQINHEDWEALYQVLITSHCLVTAWIADIHHLIHYNVPPQLPALLPELVSNDEFNLLPLSEIVTAIVAGYKNTFKALEIEQPHWVPELALDLGFSLASLEDKQFANEQIHGSITAFLRSRQCTDLKVIDSHEQLKNILVYGDNDYFEKLKKLISLVGKENVIPEANKLLQAWSEVAPVSNIVLDKPVLEKKPVVTTKSIPQQGEAMSNIQENTNIDQILKNKDKQIQDYYSEWSEIKNTTTKLLEDSEETTSIVETDSALKKAIEEFKHEIIENPRLTLATTGTTSGGKSSLVNLLCGAEIMPTAVQEMSAGTVIIDHHPTERSLKIPPLEIPPPQEKLKELAKKLAKAALKKENNVDANVDSPEYKSKFEDKYRILADNYSKLADNCGESSNLSENNISERLKTVMNAYRKLREENCEPPAPRIKVQYPTRLGMDPELLGLPKQSQLRIIDLPGLNAIDDDHNREVIQDEIKQAMCLVTYNSAETDKNKQQELLDQVIEGVKEAGGSPARMLFILNKIDVFLQSKEDPERFITDISKKIRTSVANELKEYKEDAEKLETQELSTLPALCAYQALNDSAELYNQVMNIFQNFNFLISQELLPSLFTSNSDKEKEENYKKVANNVWTSSYGDAFDKKLRSHIKDNLPKLLLPPLLKGVTDTGLKALTNADQIVNGYVNATDEGYKKECERLGSIRGKLKELRDNSEKELKENLEFQESDYIITEIQEISEILVESYNLPNDSLVPLYNWSDELVIGIDSFFESIKEAIIKNKPQGQLIESLPPEERQELSEVLTELHKSGYPYYAESGACIEAETMGEKDQLYKMNTSLDNLAQILAKTLKVILSRIADREMRRIVDALKVLTKGYAKFLSEETQNIAPDLAGLTITPSKLTHVEYNLELRFDFKAEFPIYKNNKENVKIGEKQVEVGEERTWKSLWFSKEKIYKKEVIYKKRSFDSADIPSIIDVFAGFIAQAKDSEADYQMAEWLKGQINDFLDRIKDYQETLLKEYRSRLDQAMKQAEQEKEDKCSQWEEMQQAISSLKKKLPELLKVT